MQCLNFLDLLTENIKLKIDGNSKINNKYASLLGLFVLFGLIIYTIIRSLDIFNKTSPSIIENKISKRKNNLTLSLTTDFAISIRNNFGIEYDEPERIYEIKAKYFEFYPRKIDNDQHLKSLDIKNSTCNFKKLDGDYDLGDLYHKKKYCFDLKPYNLSIFGSEDTPERPQSSMHFYLNMCTNTTKKNNCLPEDEIKKKLGGVKMVLYFPNKQIIRELYNPFVDFTEAKILRFSSSLSTNYIFELDAIEFKTDEGVFFEQLQNHKSYMIEKMTIFQHLMIGTPDYKGTFGKVMFFGSGKTHMIERKYQKMQSIFSYLYSIYFISFWIFKFLNRIIFKGSIEELLLFKIIKTENIIKLQSMTKTIDYEDLFTKKPNSPQEEFNYVEREFNNRNDPNNLAENKNNLENMRINENNLDNERIIENENVNENDNNNNNNDEILRKKISVREGNNIMKLNDNNNKNENENEDENANENKNENANNNVSLPIKKDTNYLKRNENENYTKSKINNKFRKAKSFNDPLKYKIDIPQVNNRVEFNQGMINNSDNHLISTFPKKIYIEK